VNDTMTRNFVAPGVAGQQTQGTALAPVQPIAPRALLDSHNRLIDLYAQQAKTAAKVGEIVTDNDQHVSYRLSTASELSERRKTARMYLCFLGFVVAAVTTGVVWIADIAHVTSSTAQSIAIWLILFGTVQSWLTWRTLHREQTLSPEGLHLEQIQYDAQVHQTDAETRRLAVQFMGRVELAKVRLQQSQVDAQREAGRRAAWETQQRISEQMTRHMQPQHTMNRLHNYRLAVVQEAPADPQEAPEAAEYSTPAGYDLEVEADASQPQYEPEPVEPVADPVRVALLNFVADLYLDRDEQNQYRRMDSDGMLKTGVTVPWSQRGGMTKEQREQAQEILRQVSPWVMRYDNEARRWLVNVQHYRRAGDAVAAIDAAYTPAAK